MLQLVLAGQHAEWSRNNSHARFSHTLGMTCVNTCYEADAVLDPPCTIIGGTAQDGHNTSCCKLLRHNMATKLILRPSTPRDKRQEQPLQNKELLQQPMVHEDTYQGMNPTPS